MRMTADSLFSAALPPAVPPGEVCFWTGAGTSYPPPTNLPLGDDLTRAAVEKHCTPGTWEDVTELYEQTGIRDHHGRKKQAPRLESVMQSLWDSLGEKAFSILEPTRSASPNRLHYLFAQHLCLGGHHFTLNFDSCIEKAVEYQLSQQPASHGWPGTSGPLSRLIHLHGRFDTDGENEAIGLVLRNLAGGLPPAGAEAIDSILVNSPYLVVCGYSGRDYFDIDPFFHDLAAKRTDLSRLTVVWVRHVGLRNAEGVFTGSLPPQGEEGFQIVSSLQACGAKIVYLRAQTDRFCEYLAARWGLHYAVPPSKHCGAGSAPICLPIGSDERVLATAKLYFSLGMGMRVLAHRDELARVANDTSASPQMRWLAATLLSHAYQDTGLYKHALRQSTLLPVYSPQSKVERLVRIAGDLWLGRHLWRSWLAFGVALREAAQLRRNRDWDSMRVRSEAAIDFLHLFRDIRRIPLIGKLARTRKAASVLKELLLESEFLSRDIQARDKVCRLCRDIAGIDSLVLLPPWIQRPTDTLVSDFLESDSVFATVNFLRSKIRDHTPPHMIRPEEVKRLEDMSRMVEDRAGLLKVAMLKAQLHHRADLSVLRTLREIEWCSAFKIHWAFAWLWHAFPLLWGLSRMLRNRKGLRSQ